MPVKITKLEWTAISAAAFFVWWPFAIAICSPHHVEGWNLRQDEFWSFKIGDVATWIILIAQGGIFAVQAYLAHSQRSVMKGQMDAAIKSADAAHLSAQVAERTLNSVESPYVFVYGMSEVKWDILQGYVTVSVANHGKTPAIIKSVMGGPAIWVGGKPDFGIELAPENELFRKPVLAAGEVRHGVRFDVPDGINFKYNHPELAPEEDFGCVITLSYRDVFGKSSFKRWLWILNKNTNDWKSFG